TARVSPDLQRALFLAMARELGWLTPAEIEAASNRTGVAFVDLRQGTNNVANTSGLPKADLQAAEASAASSVAAGSGGAIPVFTSTDSASFAVDSSVATNGST